MVGPLDPYTRAHRVMGRSLAVGAMLALAFAAFATKGVACCEGMKRQLGCPEPITASSECFGYTTCLELMEDDAFREEAAAYTCSEFPEESLVGQVMAAVAVAIAVLPVSLAWDTLVAAGRQHRFPRCWVSAAETVEQEVRG
eukprot:gene14771-17453_t